MVSTVDRIVRLFIGSYRLEFRALLSHVRGCETHFLIVYLWLNLFSRFTFWIQVLVYRPCPVPWLLCLITTLVTLNIYD